MGIKYSEENRLLKRHLVRTPGARATFCRLRLADKAWAQQQTDLAGLDQLITDALVKPERDISYYITQSTLRPGSWSRNLSSVMLLNACWLDIDLAHPPDKFERVGLRAPRGDPASLAHLLVRQIIDAGLPAPTYVVATGGGLAVKWLFTEPLPVAARARWQSTQTHLMDRIEQIIVAPGVRWPVDRLASDAARVLRLVGTFNPRWRAPCWICWDGGQEYRFGALADEVLPYTAAELAVRREAAIQGKEWDSNRARAAAEGLRARRGSAVQSVDHPQQDIESMMSDEAARSLWVARFEFGRQVITARGGVPENSRNNLLWPMATALAWSCGGSEVLLRHDLALLHQDLFRSSGWTMDEALNSASSVLDRLHQSVGPGTGNYRFKTSSWRKVLGVTDAEFREHGHLLGSGGGAASSQRNAGAMSMPPMEGLSYEAYKAETRRRQALGGAYAAAKRSTTHLPEVRQRAIQMAATSMTTRQIAGELGINQSTVSRWLDG